MSLDIIESLIKGKLAHAAHLNANIKFDCGADGVIYVDARGVPPKISRNDAEADLTLGVSSDVLLAILEGRQDPNIAFMMGKLKVKGPMGLAMKLNSLLED